MKYLRLLVAVAFAAVVFFGFVATPQKAEAGGPIGFSVSTNSIKILAQRVKNSGNRSARTWAVTNVYTQGEIVSNSNMFYMVMGGGTAGTNAPNHMSGEGSDGTLTYYRIPAGLRMGAVIVNDSTVDINLSHGYAAVTNKGILIKANGGSYSLFGGEYQGTMFAVAVTAGSNNLTVIEYP